jgi:hypothetical protein
MARKALNTRKIHIPYGAEWLGEREQVDAPESQVIDDFEDDFRDATKRNGDGNPQDATNPTESMTNGSMASEHLPRGNGGDAGATETDGSTGTQLAATGTWAARRNPWPCLCNFSKPKAGWCVMPISSVPLN